MLEVGMKAPDFTLPDKNGKLVSLSDFLGKKVVLYFYPKDNTPGCTRQACAFALKNKEIESKNAVVIGISKDSVNSHLNFATIYYLPFVLVSDTELSVLRKRKAIWSKFPEGRRFQLCAPILKMFFPIPTEGENWSVFPMATPLVITPKKLLRNSDMTRKRIFSTVRILFSVPMVQE